MRWLKSRNVNFGAIVAASDSAPQANAVAMVKAAQDATIRVTDQETLDESTIDFGVVLDKLKGGAPDQVPRFAGCTPSGSSRSMRRRGG
jgi:hypothetical protein